MVVSFLITVQTCLFLNGDRKKICKMGGLICEWFEMTENQGSSYCRKNYF